MIIHYCNFSRRFHPNTLFVGSLDNLANHNTETRKLCLPWLSTLQKITVSEIGNPILWFCKIRPPGFSTLGLNERTNHFHSRVTQNRATYAYIDESTGEHETGPANILVLFTPVHSYLAKDIIHNIFLLSPFDEVPLQVQRRKSGALFAVSLFVSVVALCNFDMIQSLSRFVAFSFNSSRCADMNHIAKFLQEKKERICEQFIAFSVPLSIGSTLRTNLYTGD